MIKIMNESNRKMKRMCLLSLFSYFILFAFASCIDDRSGTEANSANGSTVTLKLSLYSKTGGTAAATRMLNSTIPQTGDTIYNVAVLVYNSGGSLVGKAAAYHLQDVARISNPLPLNMTISSPSDGCTIYAVANLVPSAVFANGSSQSNLLLYLKGLQSTLTVSGKTTLSDPTDLVNADSTAMFGVKTGVKILSTTSVLEDSMTVRRLDTRIGFTLTGTNGIKITGYQLCHVPLSSNVYPYDDNVHFNPGGTYKDFAKVDVTGGGATSTSPLTPYVVYENLVGKVAAATSDLLRNASAPANATYLLVYAKDANSNVATFRYYLGGMNATDYTNYNVYRSYYYNYNIQINSLAAKDSHILWDAPQSNCYVLKPGGYSVAIPVAQANTYVPTRLNVAGNTWSCGLLWTDNANGLSQSGAVASVNADLNNGRIYVTSGSATGNAVVYVMDNNVIKWSWHIWVTDYDPDTNYLYWGNSTTKWMDRNLGATTNTPGNVSSNGFLYQWGRKDPFPGLSSYTAATPITLYAANKATMSMSTDTSEPSADDAYIQKSIANPFTLYSSTKDWESSSSMYRQPTWLDGYNPCPANWHVPTVSQLGIFATSTTSYSNYSLSISSYPKLFIPAAGFINQAGAGYKFPSSFGGIYYSRGDNDAGTWPYTASYFFNGSNTFTYYYSTGIPRALAGSVRCVRDN